MSVASAVEHMFSDPIPFTQAGKAAGGASASGAGGAWTAHLHEGHLVAYGSGEDSSSSSGSDLSDSSSDEELGGGSGTGAGPARVAHGPPALGPGPGPGVHPAGEGGSSSQEGAVEPSPAKKARLALE